MHTTGERQANAPQCKAKIPGQTTRPGKLLRQQSPAFPVTEGLELSDTQAKGQAERIAATARAHFPILTSCSAFRLGRRRVSILLDFSCFKFNDAVEVLMRQVRLVQRADKRKAVFLGQSGQQRKYLSAEVRIQRSYRLVRPPRSRLLRDHSPPADTS